MVIGNSLPIIDDHSIELKIQGEGAAAVKFEKEALRNQALPYLGLLICPGILPIVP